MTDRFNDKVNSVLSELEIPLRSSSEDPYHQLFHRFLNSVNGKKDPVILELGSRDVSDLIRKDWFQAPKEYIGFDILTGPNVDVQGDIHELSKYFEPSSIDVIFSISVFEHLMMPWKAVLEINKVLKTGGEVYISTHPTWSPHELPWDFFRFLKNSAESLFNRYTGFELLEVEEGLPCRILSLAEDPPTLGLKFQPANLGIGILARKISDHSPSLQWDILPSDINDTMYPKRK